MKNMRKIRVLKLGIFLGLWFDWEKSGKREGWGGGCCERKRNGGNEWEGSFGSVVVRLFGMDAPCKLLSRGATVRLVSVSLQG